MVCSNIEPKKRSALKPLGVMIGAIIVTAGVLSYPASIYTCNSVYDRQMEILQEKFGKDAGNNVIVAYDESERSLTNRNGVFTLTYSGKEDNQDNALTIRFKADTEFGFFGFNTQIVPDEQYGSFPEMSKYIKSFPKITSAVHYLPWSDKISYKSDVGGFDLVLYPENKDKIDHIESTGFQVNLVMKRDSHFTPIKDVMSVIEKGGEDFQFTLDSNNLQLTMSDPVSKSSAQINSTSKDNIILTIDGIHYNSTILSSIPVKVNALLDNVDLRAGESGSAVVKGFNFKQDLLRSGETYGLDYLISMPQLTVDIAKDQQYEFSDINVHSALVDMQPNALLSMLYFSSSEFIKRTKTNEEIGLEYEKVMEQSREFFYQWDLKDFTIKSANGGVGHANGHFKAKLFNEDDLSPSSTVDITFNPKFLDYVTGKNVSDDLKNFLITKFLVEKTDENNANEKQYYIKLESNNGKFKINGKKL